MAAIPVGPSDSRLTGTTRPPHVWLANFDFETRLQGKRISAAAQHIAQTFAPQLIALASRGDAIFVPTTTVAAERQRLETLLDRSVHWVDMPAEIGETFSVVDEDRSLFVAEHNAGWRLSPWGWDAFAHKIAKQFHLRADAPSQTVVVQANSRGFSFDLEVDTGTQLPHARRLERVNDIENWLSRTPLPHGWVLKSALSAAARHCWRGRHRELSPAQRQELQSALNHDGYVIAEPWLKRIAEVSLHYEIPSPNAQGTEAARSPVYRGFTELLCTPDGRYAGSRMVRDEPCSDMWPSALICQLREIGDQAAAEVQSLGYFGPLGIDAMLYQTTGGAVQLRCLQDLNARFTMGRLALGWREAMGEAEHVTWLIGKQPSLHQGVDRQLELESRLPAAVRGLVTSAVSSRANPSPAGKRQAIGWSFCSVLLSSTEQAALAAAETTVSQWLRG